LEAIGLVLAALGVLVLGLLLPLLPTGELGVAARDLLIGRVGVGAYLLPWPPLVLGGLFLLRRSPKGWPRMLAGYLVLGLGLWLLVTLVRPALGGSWGEALHAAIQVAGALSYLLALLIVSLGLELLLQRPPTSLLRAGVKGSVQGVQRALRGGMRLRRRAKAKAAFHADVSLARRALRELQGDLGALGRLYPGSAELDGWRARVKRSLKNLADADEEILADTQADVQAWGEALGSFSRSRAGELLTQLHAEGLPEFEAWREETAAALDEPVAGEVRAARPLDDLRKALMLDLTALGERYRRLLRERDLAAAGLREVTPRTLVRAFEQHGARLARFQEVAEAQAALTHDVGLLAPWRALLGRLGALLRDLPGDPALEEFDAGLAKRLKRGRGVLAEVETHEEELGALAAALHVAEGESVDGPDVDGEGDADELEADAPDALKVSEADDPPWEDEEDAAPAEPLPEVGGIPIQIPPLELLDAPDHTFEDPAAQTREVRSRIAKIDETLANFRLQGRVVASVRGPTVTRFEVEPAPGEKISRFSGLSDDLALAMAVGSVRIEAPIPGKSVIGLEVPNASRDLIKFREAAESPPFRRGKGRLPLILGKSIDGEMVVGDLAKMPHLLIAGSTGSGKSVAVNTLVGSLIYKFLPTDLRFLMIDPKMVELTPFDGIPHLLRPVVTNPNDAAGVLLGAVAHMERRYKMMSKIGAKNLDQYNQKARNLDLPEMPFIIIIIDELADLMITSPKEVESAIMRLAQMARATGMHLILATQRPSVDILTSLIKVNVPARVAFAVSSSHDSRTILDTMGAERLTGMGDMLFYQPGLVKPVRLQGPFISEDEIYTLANFLRRQYFEDEFVEAYGSDFDPPPADDSAASGLVDWNDDKLREAAELVINEGQASVSRLQRRLSVGHARAGKLMDSLEALGVVGAHVGSKPREVLVELDELPNLFGK